MCVHFSFPVSCHCLELRDSGRFLALKVSVWSAVVSAYLCDPNLPQKDTVLFSQVWTLRPRVVTEPAQGHRVIMCLYSPIPLALNSLWVLNIEEPGTFSSKRRLGSQWTCGLFTQYNELLRNWVWWSSPKTLDSWLHRLHHLYESNLDQAHSQGTSLLLQQVAQWGSASAICSQ